MNKIITIPLNSLQSKITTLATHLNITSPSEITTIQAIYQLHKNEPFSLNKITKEQLNREFISITPELTQAAFNQALSRLHRKGVIKRLEGKLWVLSPIFKDIDKCNQIIFRFEDKKE